MSVCSDSEECCEHDVCDLCADERVEETCCTHCDESYDPHCSKWQYARGKFDPFCSDECREADEPMDEVECTQCENLFDPKCTHAEFDAVEQRLTMVYCSAKCYNKHNESEDKDHPEHWAEEKPKPKVGLRRLTAEEMAVKYPKEEKMAEELLADVKSKCFCGKVKREEGKTFHCKKCNRCCCADCGEDEDKLCSECVKCGAKEDERLCEKCDCDISDESGVEFFYCIGREVYFCLDCAPEEEVCDCKGDCDMCRPKRDEDEICPLCDGDNGNSKGTAASNSCCFCEGILFCDDCVTPCKKNRACKHDWEGGHHICNSCIEGMDKDKVKRLTKGL